ncbi:hypothetical protein M569_04841, partial [Genlisea aurea]
YGKLFKMCTVLGKLEEGRMVHSHFLASRFRSSPVVQNTVINMYAKAGNLELARKVFDEMIDRDMVSYTMLVAGFSQINEFRKALEVYGDMIREGLHPNEFSFGSALKSAGGLKSDDAGRSLHGSCIKYGHDFNVYVGSALVDMYARCTRMEDAEKTFDGLKNRNEACWNSLIAAYAREGDAPNALKLFSEMKRSGLEPTHYTYSSIFSACAECGSLEQGKWAHADMLKSGVESAAFVGNTLVAMYGRGGSVEDAEKVFRRLAWKDVVSWNSMLTACTQHGLGREAVGLFEEMRGGGFRPDGVTFLCVVAACSHAGLVEEGLRYAEEMEVGYGYRPSAAHYAAAVDLLGRSGELERAERCIREMKVEPTAGVWKALLGACRVHGDAEMAAYAAERVFRLDPLDAGPRVLLANAYAAAGRPGDAGRVRAAMKRSGVRKEPGCSWVELANAVHVFVAGDYSHPLGEEIRRKWEELREGCRRFGYAAAAAEEGNDRVRRRRHSEKLALAFSLISTAAGVPIVIKKNMRVCGDCHTAFKFVSRLVGREIVLRDINRFHRFGHGRCNCNDFW